MRSPPKSVTVENPAAQQTYATLPYPLGPTITSEGANFSVFSASATRIELVFFDHAEDPLPSRAIVLDSLLDRTSHYWHVFVPGIKPGQLYGYRADGPNDPANGQRFDSQKVLLDPYGKSVSVGRNYDRAVACKPGNNAATCMKSVLADLSLFDWEGDQPLCRPFRRSVIYEMHVAGFTRHPNSGVTPANRGTYLGVIEKIPYLQELGITAVELLPIYQFDAGDAPPEVSNYWGYDPISFFSPHVAYSSSKDPLSCLDEFRTMVKELHRAGIEVILDVVYNHTAEGGEKGPTLCFRGLENSFYYILNQDQATYADYTGAGNTLKANHSVVKRLIMDSLRYWTSEMHVDGFRFDLASIFSRDDNGKPMMNPPILWEIDSDPVLAGSKLIAEPWDAAGLYQVGSFGQDRWKEWNGKFRDEIRAFIKGDHNSVWRLQERVTGSFDLYREGGRPAGQSINFVTCHDGFTLNDLVSFDHKHNDANHERSRDGSNNNASWNCGVEGAEAPPDVDLLRARQIRNFFALTLLSVGTPMLLMGDEIRRTQRGNNNAYCQDNEISWFDWAYCERNADLLRFVRNLIRLRLNFNQGTKTGPITLEDYLSKAQIEWHGVQPGKPDWGRNSHSVALTLHNIALSQVRYIAINAYWQPLEFELPPVNGYSDASWLRLIDTSLPSPNDISAEGNDLVKVGARYLVNPRSIVMLHHHDVTNREAGMQQP